MKRLLAGMTAGLLATIVLSLLMAMKSAMGVMPELDVARMLGAMMGTGATGGWLAHFAIGTIAWGGLFALLEGTLPGQSRWIHGIVFGVAAWLIMMIAVMPMAEKGLFGMSMGPMAPVMTLALHVIYGAVLGLAYARLISGQREQGGSGVG
jgi:hypothetical protein